MKHPFAEKFTSDPLLIDPHRADLVSASLDHLSSDPEAVKRLDENMALGGVDDFWSGGDDDFYRPYTVRDGVLQIPIRGVLIHRMSFALGGWATGYKYIEKALERGLADANVKGVALVVDSPGGMVAGCFELADKIYEARSEKPIRAFAADAAYSAAYALSSAAQEVIVTRSGGTGSVGVVTMHVDYSKALAQAGIKVTYIFAGKHKVDGNAVEPLPDAVKARIQSRIDSIYSVFTGSVARGRGIDEKAVRDTEALCFDSEESVAHGFADRIGAFDDEIATFALELADTDDDDEESPLMTDKTKTDEQAATGITQAQLDTAAATAKAEGVAAERTRMTTILGSDVAKARPKLAQSMVAKGIDAETALSLLADAPEEKAAAPEPTPEPKKKASGTPFDKHMNAEDHPEVGVDDDDDKDEDDDQAVASSLLAAHRAATGRRPVRKQ